MLEKAYLEINNNYNDLRYRILPAPTGETERKKLDKYLMNKGIALFDAQLDMAYKAYLGGLWRWFAYKLNIGNLPSDIQPEYQGIVKVPVAQSNGAVLLPLVVKLALKDYHGYNTIPINPVYLSEPNRTGGRFPYAWLSNGGNPEDFLFIDVSYSILSSPEIIK